MSFTLSTSLKPNRAAPSFPPPPRSSQSQLAHSVNLVRGKTYHKHLVQWLVECGALVEHATNGQLAEGSRTWTDLDLVVRYGTRAEGAEGDEEVRGWGWGVCQT